MFVAFLAQASRGHLAMVFPATEVAFELTSNGATVINVRTGGFVHSPHDPHRALHLLSSPVAKETAEQAWAAAHMLLNDYEKRLTPPTPPAAPAPSKRSGDQSLI